MRVAFLAVATMTFVLAVSASAARKPTTPEGKAIRSAIAGYIATPFSPAAKDNKIVSISVSSLDHRYASARLNSTSAGPADIVLHLSRGTWWVEQFGSSLSCEAAPKAVLADLKVGCTPPNAVAWISNCGPLVSAPKSLVLTCADANYAISKLTWSGWGKTAATAKGTVSANDCTPNCAAGHNHSYAVTITADQLKSCGRAKVYLRVTLVYPGKRPAGIAARDVHTLTC
jgi:phage terminase large subunit-like protein